MVLVLFTMRLMLLQNCCMVVRFVASYIKNNILAISNTILKFDCVLRAHFTVSQKTSMVWRWNILNYITMTMIVDPLWRIYDEIGFKLSSKLNKSIWSVLNLLVLLKNCLFWSQFEILNEHCTDCRVLRFDHVYSGIDFWAYTYWKKEQNNPIFFPSQMKDSTVNFQKLVRKDIVDWMDFELWLPVFDVISRFFGNFSFKLVKGGGVELGT